MILIRTVIFEKLFLIKHPKLGLPLLFVVKSLKNVVNVLKNVVNFLKMLLTS